MLNAKYSFWRNLFWILYSLLNRIYLQIFDWFWAHHAIERHTECDFFSMNMYYFLSIHWFLVNKFKTKIKLRINEEDEDGKDTKFEAIVTDIE